MFLAQYCRVALSPLRGLSSIAKTIDTGEGGVWVVFKSLGIFCPWDVISLCDLSYWLIGSEKKKWPFFKFITAGMTFWNGVSLNILYALLIHLVINITVKYHMLSDKCCACLLLSFSFDITNCPSQKILMYSYWWACRFGLCSGFTIHLMKSLDFFSLQQQ